MLTPFPPTVNSLELVSGSVISLFSDISYADFCLRAPSLRLEPYRSAVLLLPLLAKDVCLLPCFSAAMNTRYAGGAVIFVSVGG